MQVYRGPQACELTGVSYRRLDYWDRTGLVRPSVAKADGSGTQRLYNFEDLVKLRVIKDLIDIGMELPAIRALLQGYDADKRMEVRNGGVVVVVDVEAVKARLRRSVA